MGNLHAWIRSSLAPALLLAALFTVTLPLSAEGTPRPVITIEKPEGWKSGELALGVSVDGSSMGDGFSVSRIEAKTGDGDGWTDITGSGAVTVDGNTTVYIRVTDAQGNVYEQNRSVRCYDEERPTLAASLTDGVLSIQGNDTVSGIASITVNGATYTNLEDGKLRIQLTQDDFLVKKIRITAEDMAGNVSEVYSMPNPYYEWAAGEAQRQEAEREDGGLPAPTPAGEAGDAGMEPVLAPLPQDAEASGPTEARGTVEEWEDTGDAEDWEDARKMDGWEGGGSGEGPGWAADAAGSPPQKDGREFFTISTKSGKVFYLVVDNSRQEDNVYLLTEAGEKDLMNFTLSNTVELPPADTVYAEPETDPAPPEPETTAVPEEPEHPEKPESRPKAGGFLLLAVACGGALLAGYYFKIYKPKHTFLEEEYEEGMEPENDAMEPDGPGPDGAGWPGGDGYGG